MCSMYFCVLSSYKMQQRHWMKCDVLFCDVSGHRGIRGGLKLNLLLWKQTHRQLHHLHGDRLECETLQFK